MQDDVLLDEDQELNIYDETSTEFYDSELDFTTSDISSDSEDEIKQQTENLIVDGPKADFKPLPGKYGPYFQNFTEIMLFTWVTKHMISK